MVNTTLFDNRAIFETAAGPPPEGTPSFSPEEWEEVRSSGILPLHVSNLSDDDEGRREFIAGAELLGLTTNGQTVKPQQLYVSDVLQAGAETVGIIMPRRSSKSTSILAVLLGRCLTRPRYSVRFSAQSGTKSNEFFREWVTILEIEQGDTPESQWPFKIRLAAASQEIVFRNGSSFKLVNKPAASALRGSAADVVWFDESQEFNAELSAELRAGALPLMDTRQNPQLILSGTAGKARAGWLWDTLELGRDPENSTGILEYAAPADTDFEQIHDEEVWKKSHPGIGTLTTLDKMRQRHTEFASPEWSAEYLCIWPEDYSTSAIPSALWTAAAAERVAIPEHVAFGFDVAPDGSSSCLVAAWRLDGVAYVEIIAHDQGSSWLNKKVQAVSRKYRAPVGYDSIGANKAAADEMERMRPKPKLQAVSMADLGAANAVFMRELTDGKLKHFEQPGLTIAASNAARRPLGTKGAWGWNRGASGADITPLLATTLALRIYDQSQAPRAALKPKIA